MEYFKTHFMVFVGTGFIYNGLYKVTSKIPNKSW